VSALEKLLYMVRTFLAGSDDKKDAVWWKRYGFVGEMMRFSTWYR
jgi:hypothetical protein